MKKSSKIVLSVFIGIIVAIFLCLLVAVVIFGKNIENFARRQFTSPESYMKYVAGKNIDSALNDFEQAYNKSIERGKQYYSNGGADAGIELNLSDAGKKAIESLGIPYVDWINKFRLEYSLDNLDEKNYISSKLIVNDVDIVSANIHNDSVEKELKIEVDDVFDSILVIKDNLYDEVIQPMVDHADIYDEVPDGKTLKNVFKKYIKVIFDNIEDVNLHKDKRKVGDISQDLYILSTTFDSEDAKNIIEDMYDIVKDDDELEEILEIFYGRNGYGSYIYDDLIMELEAAKEEITGNEEEELYVDFILNNEGKFVGLSISSNDDGNFTTLFLKKGRAFAFKFEYQSPYGDGYSFRGEGERIGLKANGEFEFVQDGTEIFSIDLKDVDLRALKKGDLMVDATVKIPAGTVNESLYLLDEGVDFDITINSTMDNSKMELSTSYAGEELLVLKTESKLRKFKKMKDLSGEELTINEINDIYGYMSNIKLDKVIENLKEAGMPEELAAIYDLLY